MCTRAGASAVTEKRKRMTYETRAGLTKNAMGKTCFELMAQKGTNLCVAVDTVDVDDVLKLAAQVGPYICVLKTHVDMFATWDTSHVSTLQVSFCHQYACFLNHIRRFVVHCARWLVLMGGVGGGGTVHIKPLSFAGM